MSNRTIYSMATAAMLSVTLPAASQAATVLPTTTTSTASVVQLDRQNVSDPTTITRDDATGTNANVTASVNDSIAVQNSDGTSGATAVATPFGGSTLVTSSASFSQTFQNTSTGDLAYDLNFELEGLSTRIFTTRNYGSNFVNPFASDDPTIMPDSSYTAASFEYNIALDGDVVYTARADALGQATFGPAPGFDPGQDYTFENVENFTASIDPLAGGFFGNDAFTFSVADLMGEVDLGIFGAGESFEITTTLTARAYARAFEGENGVGAFSFDPVNVNAVGLTSSVPTPTMAAVPLPAAGWMLIAGLGGLAAMKRRKKA